MARPASIADALLTTSASVGGGSAGGLPGGWGGAAFMVRPPRGRPAPRIVTAIAAVRLAIGEARDHAADDAHRREGVAGANAPCPPSCPSASRTADLQRLWIASSVFGAPLAVGLDAERGLGLLQRLDGPAPHAAPTSPV
jgi:hypothetical protein